MKAYELLADKANWTQGEPARQPNGQSVAPSSMLACKWCMVGAIVRCYPNSVEQSALVTRLRRTILNVEGCSGSVASFNDDPNTTHAQVLDILKLADI